MRDLELCVCGFVFAYVCKRGGIRRGQKKGEDSNSRDGTIINEENILGEVKSENLEGSSDSRLSLKSWCIEKEQSSFS